MINLILTPQPLKTEAHAEDIAEAKLYADKECARWSDLSWDNVYADKLRELTQFREWEAGEEAEREAVKTREVRASQILEKEFPEVSAEKWLSTLRKARTEMFFEPVFSSDKKEDRFYKAYHWVENG